MSPTQDFIQHLVNEDHESLNHMRSTDPTYGNIDFEEVYNTVTSTEDPIACRLLGCMYVQGDLGTEKEITDRGLHLLALSARIPMDDRSVCVKGDFLSQNELVNIYMHGLYGFAQDATKMLYYCEESARQGNITSMSRLVEIYVQAHAFHGVKRDMDKAFYYAGLVIDNGGSKAQMYSLAETFPSIAINYWVDNKDVLKKQIEDLEAKVEAQEEEIVELKYRPYGKGYEEAKADFTKLSE